ncbi:hypothetical protein J0S82_006432 [Galemys pyrenaicus]|uniref:KRAB domain-containing protein n=1 Tax=Galemys pyrenaicus TaxID=202257 RepID=A0A8J5ZY75_GALPY|nr:hypothetical protein J0S82_006432 [Galemys pyrenaicus]
MLEGSVQELGQERAPRSFWLSEPRGAEASPSSCPVSVTFEDVAMCISWDEWSLLRQAQKDLYHDVMPENFAFLFSLAYNVHIRKFPGRWRLPHAFQLSRTRSCKFHGQCPLTFDSQQVFAESIIDLLERVQGVSLDNSDTVFAGVMG